MAGTFKGLIALPTVILVSLAIGGCAGNGNLRSAKTGFFTPLPGRSAAATGSTTADALISSLNGGLIATGPAAKLGAGDRKRALEAEYRALETAPAGRAITWAGGRDGTGGSVKAAAPYQVGSQNCRQYSHVVTIGTDTEEVRGAACRNEDGSWTPLT